MTIRAIASATPSTMPMVTMEAPRTVTMNTGSTLWISSEEISMNIEPSPRAQIAAGKARRAAGVARDDRDSFGSTALTSTRGA